eukprot:GHVT01002162.1.p1 GENE.GHVT01002162.1~~GHVT01002162.1.p1  ORF type:complete len:163 (+),score=37.14 GHVT01002162.1:321-809(+)
MAVFREEPSAEGKSGWVDFSTYLPAKDPVNFVKLNSDPKEFLCGTFWVGAPVKSDEHPPLNKILFKLEATSCKAICEGSEAGGFATSTAHLPLVRDAYSRGVTTKIFMKEEKFVARVTKITVSVPPEIYKEWEEYYLAVREWVKEEKESEKSDDKDKDSKKE